MVEDSATGDPGEVEAVPYQSLYRRYRPQRFSEVRGQEHVTRALLNSVRDGRVAHAYLFSGPRGTGKTSTARILAMALNCQAPIEGEPCGVCASCVAIRQGSSLDVHEMDAASNRRIDEIRDLLAGVALGTPGRSKVYIIDEVHQLTADASSALLKTLEEPPGHVIFVLATTDPQRVLPTIKSRTQHFEFHLLGADVLAGLLGDVNSAARLGVPPEAIDLVVRRGHGSARDALSVLDQVAAAGAVEPETAVVFDIADALADRDVGRVLVAVAESMSAGHDPRRLAADLIAHLRNGFLATQARSLVLLSDDDTARVEAQAQRFGLAALVRAMEVIGQAAIDMRDSIDPRVTLEVALVRVASPAADPQPAALLTRIEDLERRLAGGGPVPLTSPPPVPTAQVAPQARPPAPTAQVVHQPSPPGQAEEPPPEPQAAERRPAAPRSTEPRPVMPPAGRPSLGAPPPTPRPRTGGAPPPQRPTLGSPPVLRQPSGNRPQPAPPDDQPPPTTPPAPSPSAAPATPAAPAAPAGQRPGSPAAAPPPTRDELTVAWGDVILPGLPGSVRAYVQLGRWLSAEDGAAVYAVPDRGLLARAQPVQGEVEEALRAHFGRPVPLRLVLDDGSIAPPPQSAPAGGAAADAPPPAEPPADEGDEGHEGDEGEDPADYDLAGMEDAGAVVSPQQRLLQAFPGAEEVTP